MANQTTKSSAIRINPDIHKRAKRFILDHDFKSLSEFAEISMVKNMDNLEKKAAKVTMQNAIN